MVVKLLWRMGLPVVTLVVIGFIAFHQVIWVGAAWLDRLHMALSLVTLLLLLMSTVLVFVYILADFLIRRSYLHYLKYMPSLESLEFVLFQTLLFSFTCLSLLLVSSLFFYHNIILTQALYLHKCLMSCVVWLLLLWIMVARAMWGWRGRKVTYLTLLSVFIFILIYCFSQWMMTDGGSV